MKTNFLISTALAAVLCASHPAFAGSMDYFKSTEDTTSPIDTSSDETAAKSQASEDADQPLLKPARKTEAPVAAAPAEDTSPVDTSAPDKDYKPYLTSSSPQKTGDMAPVAANAPQSGAAALVSKRPQMSSDALPPLLARPQMRVMPASPAPVPPPAVMPANPETPVAAAPVAAPAVPTAPVLAPEKPMAERGMTAPIDTHSMPVAPPATAAAPVPVNTPPAAPDAAPAVPSLADLSLAFDGDSTDLTPDNQRKLGNLVPHLKEMQDGHLQVRGFANGAKNDHSTAKRIALARVLAVRSYFLDKGVPAKVIDVKVKGAEDDGKNADRVDLLFESNP